MNSIGSSGFSLSFNGRKTPVEAAASAVGRIARSQAFTEGNKRTALLVGRWILDRNDVDGLRFIPEDDSELGNLLLSAASGSFLAIR